MVPALLQRGTLLANLTSDMIGGTIGIERHVAAHYAMVLSYAATLPSLRFRYICIHVPSILF